MKPGIEPNGVKIVLFLPCFMNSCCICSIRTVSFKGWSALVLGIVTLAPWRTFDGLPSLSFAVLISKTLDQGHIFPAGWLEQSKPITEWVIYLGLVLS
jgi:hypothetical protein